MTSRRAILYTVVAAMCLLLAGAWLFTGQQEPGVVEAEPTGQQRDRLEPGSRATFEATAYCVDGTTRSGVETEHGVAAADPEVLPVGSVIRVGTPDGNHSGVYSILDTGKEVKGREIDIFLRDCDAATEFGRQQVDITVIRFGWNPAGARR